MLYKKIVHCLECIYNALDIIITIVHCTIERVKMKENGKGIGGQKKLNKYLYQ